MKTTATADGDDWVINGREIWISRIAKADFTIVMAVTDGNLGSRGGITAFQKLVDRQAIQWWMADAATNLRACRLMACSP